MSMTKTTAITKNELLRTCEGAINVFRDRLWRTCLPCAACSTPHSDMRVGSILPEAKTVPMLFGAFMKTLQSKMGDVGGLGNFDSTVVLIRRKFRCLENAESGFPQDPSHNRPLVFT